MTRLLCWLSLHKPMQGIHPAWSLVWVCVRCGHSQPGGILEREGRR